MNKVAAKCRIDRAVDIVKLAKRQHTTRIKAVGVRDPVVDLGGGKLPRTRFNRRCRPWPRARCHGRNRRQGRQAVVKTPSAIDSGLDTQRGKDSPQPLQPAAWRCHRVLIPERPRDDHLRRADRHPDVMGAETRYASCAPEGPRPRASRHSSMGRFPGAAASCLH